jgi:branched-chain amino acid transport system ATP-binding protein
VNPQSKATLQVEDLSIHFGGIQALKAVEFQVEPGKIVGVMGPNGAGKTTLFNLISGVYRPSSGRITFEGRELHRLKPSRVCHAGIGRTFQSGKPFTNLTAVENVMVGLFYGGAEVSPRPREAREQARQILDFVGLAGQADRPVTSLSLMERKIVELARTLATKPRFLLLDELLAGFHPANLAGAIEVIRRVRDELGITILWIEHIMRVLVDVCEHLIVLHHGEKLAEGLPKEVVENPEVAEAYFGKKRGLPLG